MPREYCFWVYILSSRSRSLYVGMTNDLSMRLATHREGEPGSYTARYKIHRLVYFEEHQYVLNAIAREKELKKWTRAQKVELIERLNPTWEDLSAGWALGPGYGTPTGLLGRSRSKARTTAKATTEADSLRE